MSSSKHICMVGTLFSFSFVHIFICTVQFAFNILMIFVSVSLLCKDKMAIRNVNLEGYLTVFHVKAMVVDPLLIILQGSWQCLFLKEVSSDICIGLPSYLYKLYL